MSVISNDTEEVVSSFKEKYFARQGKESWFREAKMKAAQDRNKEVYEKNDGKYLGTKSPDYHRAWVFYNAKLIALGISEGKHSIDSWRRSLKESIDPSCRPPADDDDWDDDLNIDFDEDEEDDGFGL